MELKAGETLTINGYEYRLESALAAGVGSYGKIWAATDSKHRPVVLKFIHAENQAQAGETAGQQWQKHLQREIEFLKQLTDEQTRHIVKLLNHGEIDGQPVLVLERLHTNLNHWIHHQPKPLPLRQILEWAQQILAGLAIVHAHGLVYRDLKFSNVLVSDDGQRLKLADFGTVKALRDDGSQFSYAGTPTMMAPEQRLPARIEDGKPSYAVTERSDSYALGLMLFRLFTDQPTIASQELIEDALKKNGYEGVLQNGQIWGGLNEAEKRQLHNAILAGWGLDETTVGPGQHDRPQQAQALYDLILELLNPCEKNRPDSAEAIRQIREVALNAAPATAPAPASPPAAVSPQTPPPRSNPPATVLPPVTPPPPSPLPIPDHSSTVPRQRRWVYALVVLVGVSALAGGIEYWWPHATPPKDTAPPLPDEPPMVPKQTGSGLTPLSPVPAPESVPKPVNPAADALAQPTSSGALPAESPAAATTTPPVSANAAPSLAPVPPPIQSPVAAVMPTASPTVPAKPSVPSSAAGSAPVAPAKPSPVPPPAAAPEPVTTVETPVTEKPIKPLPSQPLPQHRNPLAHETPPATVWRKLERDPLAVGGFAPELIVVPAGALEFTGQNGQVQRVSIPEFALATQLVTRADYAVFARYTGRSLPPARDFAVASEVGQPVTMITWQEAQAYVEWLSQQTGRHYRLLREFEWVYSQKRGVDSGQDSAWAGFEWTASCDFGDCRRDQRMVWSMAGKREARPADQGGRDISFRVVRE